MTAHLHYYEKGLITVSDAILTGRSGKAVTVFELNFAQFVNHNAKVLGTRLYLPSLTDAAWLAGAQLIF